MTFSKTALSLLRDRYFLPEENESQFLGRVSSAYATDEMHATRLLEYLVNHWFLPATPILSNGGTNRGLPVSCFLNYVEDSRAGLADHYTESLFMSTTGGGIGSYWGNIRSVGEKTSTGNSTTGAIPFLHAADALILASNQGSTRRGSYAAYLDISHPEIIEFLDMRKPSGGDVHRKCLNLHHGVNLSDEFMQAVIEDREFELVDPHSKRVKTKLPARQLWQRILENRMLTGEPYLHFIDTSNKALHPDLVKQGFRIYHSNLCSEILLPTSPEYSNVCILSSVNLEKWDEWKDNPIFIRDILEFLDNVVESFIRTAPTYLSKAVAAATHERSIGLGTMGFHSLLQSKNIPFESALAESFNRTIFQRISNMVEEADGYLCQARGPAAGLTKNRFAHKTAIAPNSSTSIILNTSPSIEPWSSNYFTQKTKSGAFIVKNPYLEKVLKQYYSGVSLTNVWKSIRDNHGSVLHLEALTDQEKAVFKTAAEIDQHWVVHHAAVRQAWIDQGQSVNLFFPTGANVSYYNQVHLNAWKKGLKTLYYVRANAARNIQSLRFSENGECLSCQ